jgi:pimeloyl-ACP methyl ester carboxylesterase
LTALLTQCSDISRRLLRRLQNNSHKHNRRVFDYGYDWRLSPHLLVTRLIKFLSSLPCNTTVPPRGATVIAHSLGGLIVRAAVNLRPDLFAGVIFAGTPSHCVNILGPLRNGDSVLFNSKVFTAQVNFSLRTSFVFLPESGRCFIDRATGEPINLDFFDPKTWREYGLSPCVSDVKPASSILKDRGLTPNLGSSAAPAQTVTIPKKDAVKYLTRVLSSTAEFKKSLNYKPELEEKYPPMAVLYAKTTPTVRGARVDGREGIRRDDVYDELVFGAGDGVCLARAAMLPEGYKCVKKVAVDRGHLSLLGDLEAVGECIRAIRRQRGW